MAKSHSYIANSTLGAALLWTIDLVCLPHQVLAAGDAGKLILNSRHWLHDMKTWRHLHNQKYVTYHNAVRKKLSRGHTQHALNFCDVWPCDFLDIWVDGQTDGRQTDGETNILIALLRTPFGANFDMELHMPSMQNCFTARNYSLLALSVGLMSVTRRYCITRIYLLMLMERATLPDAKSTI